MHCVKEEYQTVSGARPVTPLPPKSHKIELKEWRKLTKKSPFPNANKDVPLKKIVLDVLGKRPEIWVDSKNSKKIDWEKAGVEIYELTGSVVDVKSLRHLLLHCKSALKRKLKGIIRNKNLGYLDTESEMWTLSYYGHMLWYRETIRKEELIYREAIWQKKVPEATDDELEYLGTVHNPVPGPEPDGILEEENEDEYIEIEEDEEDPETSEPYYPPSQTPFYQPSFRQGFGYQQNGSIMMDSGGLIMRESEMPAVGNYEDAQETYGRYGREVASISDGPSTVGYYPPAAMPPLSVADQVRQEIAARLESIVRHAPEKEFYVKMMFNKLIAAMHNGRLDYHEGNLEAFYQEMIENETELMEEKAKFKNARKSSVAQNQE